MPSHQDRTLELTQLPARSFPRIKSCSNTEFGHIFYIPELQQKLKFCRVISATTDAQATDARQILTIRGVQTDMP